MRRNIRIIPIEKREKDVRKYVLALIQLARDLQEEEARAAEAKQRKDGQEGGQT